MAILERKNIRLQPENYRGQRLYFATLCFHNRRRMGANPRVATWLIERMRTLARNYGFFVHAYCVMPDHLHLLAEGAMAGSDLMAFLEFFKQDTGFRFEARTRQRLWQFKYYGHQDVRLMNGGRKKWSLENRPLTQDPPRITPTSYPAKEPDNTLRAFRDQVMAVLTKPETYNLVDVRSVDEFTGKIIAPPGMSETAQRAGHIPGAQNIPWAQAVKEDGSFKSADDLKQLYQGKGVLPTKETVAYCRIGERSSHTWFVLKYLLGYNNVRNYDGSWTEWGNLVEAPIEKSAGLATVVAAEVCK